MIVKAGRIGRTIYVPFPTTTTTLRDVGGEDLAPHSPRVHLDPNLEAIDPDVTPQ